MSLAISSQATAYCTTHREYNQSPECPVRRPQVCSIIKIVQKRFYRYMATITAKLFFKIFPSCRALEGRDRGRGKSGGGWRKARTKLRSESAVFSVWEMRLSAGKPAAEGRNEICRKRSMFPAKKHEFSPFPYQELIDSYSFFSDRRFLFDPFVNNNGTT